jgi:SPP1 family predicted phage head-tail adaptor
MRSGLKREQIVIQVNTPSADGDGGFAASWSTFATVWARAEFMTGRELEGMQKVNSAVSLKFTVNYRADVLVTHRVSWRSKIWQIEAILPGESKFDMMLMVSKVE